MCAECTQLRALHSDTAARLLAAQQELAKYDPENNAKFLTLWQECEAGLKTLWRIREELAAHVCPNSDSALTAAS